FSRDVLRADVSAALQSREFDTCDLGKSLASLIRQVRIIFDVEHQHLRRIDFVFLVPRVVEGAAPKLRPIRIRNPVSISKAFEDVENVSMWRFLQKLPAALPCSAIPWINNPKALASGEIPPTVACQESKACHRTE